MKSTQPGRGSRSDPSLCVRVCVCVHALWPSQGDGAGLEAAGRAVYQSLIAGSGPTGAALLGESEEEVRELGQ